MKKLYFIIFLCLVSIANAIYLTNAALNYKAWDTSKLFCDVSDTLSCSNLFWFDFAWIFGIPFPAIALIVYPIIALIAILGILKKIKSPFKILFPIWLAGISFNSYFLVNETIVWVFCLACLICFFSIFLITTLSWLSLICKKCKQ